nr:MAG TPA: Restriction endonuclease [Caudoviricetes sp.]
MFFDKLLNTLKVENLYKNSNSIEEQSHTHTPGNPVRENEITPSCTSKGSYDEVVYCTDNECGIELSRATIAVPALGHVAGESIIENRADPKPGVAGSYDKVLYCKRCNKELNREKIILPALPKASIEKLKSKLNEAYDYSINGRDTYFIDAAKLLIENEKGSIGMLQRYFKFGFNRAVRVMDQLEEAGIVGPEEGTKPRRILMTLEQFEEYEKKLDKMPNPKPSNVNITNNVLSEKGSLLMYLNILADFSNDGKQLTNMYNAIIHNCTEAEQHKIINHLLTYNSSKTLKIIIYDDTAFSYANYNSLSQMLIPVVSDSYKITTIIEFLKNEVTDRLHKFASFQATDLHSYNSKTEPIPIIIFIISELYLVKSYFEDNSNVIQLMLNSKRTGIYLLMFSQFDIKRFSLGAIQDLIRTYSSQQAYQMLYSTQTANDMPKTINITDDMNGQQFETYCADILTKNGFSNVEVTQGSGDHGIDITAIKDEISYAIQCKCYSSNIGNAAVQQAHTGKSLYHKDIAVVLTNQYFTAQAKEEADALGVKLWDRDKLQELVNNSQ